MTALESMWVSFFGIFLMFASAAATVFAQKLPSIFRFIVLVIAFICLLIGGFIMIVIVFGGPLAE